MYFEKEYIYVLISLIFSGLYLMLYICVRKVSSLNPGPAKSYMALQAVRFRFNVCIRSWDALSLWRKDGHR